MTKILFITLTFLSLQVHAEDGDLKISGDFAASIFWESGDGMNGIGTGAPQAGGSDSSHGNFTLDEAVLDLEKTVGNTTFNLGLGYGKLFTTADSVVDVVTAKPRDTLNLTNAYVNHKIGDTGFSVKLGRFVTYMGAESYRYMNNLNYTRSYGIRLAPLFLTGAGVEYTQGIFNGGVYATNSLDTTDSDENRTMAYGASFGVNPFEGLSVQVDTIMGQNGDSAAMTDQKIYELIAVYSFDQFYTKLTYATKIDEYVFVSGKEDKISATAAYFGYKTDVWGLGLRYELVNKDPDGTVVPATPNTGLTGDEDINSVTLTAHYDVDKNARVKLEVGSQSGEDTSFVDGDGKASGSMMFYGLGFMYRF